MVKYLLERKNNYYYKRKYPTTQKNFVISLKTDSLREAKFLISIINPKFLNLIMETKMNFDEEKDYIKNIIQEYINEAKNDYEKFAKIRASRYTYRTDTKRTVLGSHPKAIKKAIKELGYAIHSPEIEKDKAIEDLTIYTSINKQYKEALKNLSEDGKERLKDEIIKAEIELLYLDKRNNTERLENPSEYIENKSIEEVREETRPTEQINTKNYREKTIKEIIELFITKKGQDTVNKDTIRRYIGDFKIFTDLVNKEYLIDLDHNDFDEFLENMKYIPDFNKNRKLFKEKNNNYKLLVEEAKKNENIECIKPQTIELKLINISALIDLAEKYELIDKNRLTGKFSKNTKKHDVIERIEYPQAELNNLFYNSSWYRENLEKNLKEAPQKIWLPLLMLFSGTRLNEAAQIYLDQIEIIDHIPFINIRKDRKDQKLKNLSSKRKMPIHWRLLEMGFMDYIEQLKKDKEERLFPKLYYTKGKGYGQAFSKVFGDYKPTFLSQQVIEQLEQKEFLLDIHSFRHSFAGSLKGKIEDGVLDSFMGHRNGSLSQTRYGSYRTDVLKNNIDLCDYPSVDFSPLMEKMRKYYKISE
ncbi:site-specific integrase [Aliarcobacter butzleri]|uniref:site-specific integrase n=1 Tax=Aliarcobacter butzleri TaxID=28197 RepID=UPI0021B5385A|nr:site-specific integrase [Aliarcobacter butzleri]MCT7650146.1 site-specific integrase [Aliarcobacter butzleri]